MESLIQEALKYAVKMNCDDGTSDVDFIAGANSNWVKSESIKERRWLLKQILIMFSLNGTDEKEVNRLIKEYDQQLKELEYENA